VKCEKSYSHGHSSGLPVVEGVLEEKGAAADFLDLPAFLPRERPPQPHPPPPPADYPDLCGHCGAPATPADPLRIYDDPDTGRPVRLHARCEGPFLGRDP
jgi:hypothetical protein